MEQMGKEKRLQERGDGGEKKSGTCPFGLVPACATSLSVCVCILSVVCSPWSCCPGWSLGVVSPAGVSCPGTGFRVDAKNGAAVSLLFARSHGGPVFGLFALNWGGRGPALHHDADGPHCSFFLINGLIVFFEASLPGLHFRGILRELQYSS